MNEIQELISAAQEKIELFVPNRIHILIPNSAMSNPSAQLRYSGCVMPK